MTEKEDLGVLGRIFSSNSDWVSRAFAVSTDSVVTAQKEEDYKVRYFSNADLLFGDTSLGGGPTLNMEPAFTEDADMPVGFGFGDGRGGYGIDYGEWHLPNMETIHLRVGTRQFNTLANFYLRMYDQEQGKLALTGNTDSFLRKVIDTITNLVWGIARVPGLLLTQFMAWVGDRPLSAYYYMRVQQPLFWSKFSAMMEDVSVKMGIVPGFFADEYTPDGIAKPYEQGLSKVEAEKFNAIAPDLFKENGGFDIYKTATRYQSLQNAWRLHQVKLASAGVDYWQWTQACATVFGALPGGRVGQRSALLAQAIKSSSTLDEVMKIYRSSSFGSGTWDMESVNYEKDAQFESTASAPDVSISSGNPFSTVTNLLFGTNTEDYKVKSLFENEYGGEYAYGISDIMKSMWQTGGAWLSLKVEPILSIEMSINNSYGPSAIAESINSAVMSARSAQMSSMGGATGLPGIDTAIRIAKNAASFVMPNAIVGMGAGASVSIPDVWQSATATMPNPSYKIVTHSVSPHPYSKLTMIAPHIALQALASCQSTGASSFMEPFLIELRHQSKNIISLGGIASLSCTHAGEIGDWDLYNLPNIMESSFTFENLTKDYNYPILKEQIVTRQEVSATSDYLSLLAGMSLHDMEAIGERLNRTTAHWRAYTDKITSSSWLGFKAASFVDSTFLHYFQFTPDKR